MASLPLKLQRARYQLLRQRPYLARILLRLQPIETDKVPTAAVDKYYRLYWHPQRVDEWSEEEWVGVLYHEALHLLYSHHSRGDQSIPHMLRNIAADLAINCQLRRENFTLPEGAVFPENYQLPKDQTFEQYLAALQKSNGNNKGKNNDSKGKNKGNGGQQSGPAAGDCGSAADGHHRDYELPAPATAADGVSKEEGELIRRSIAREIQRAAASQPGSIPGSLREWAEAELAPRRIPWQRLLAAHLRRAVAIKRGYGDYSLRTPSRRAMARGIISPSQAAPQPEIACILDTSGSMGRDAIARALGQVQSILRELAIPALTLLQWDAARADVRRVSNARRVEILGGGGTDMTSAIAEAEGLRPRPAAIIILSDGESPWPAIRPRTPVILARVRQSEWRLPSWLPVIEIGGEE